MADTLAGLVRELAARRPDAPALTFEPSRRQGDTTGPKALVSLEEPMANSSMLSLPSITAPSFQRFWVTVDS